MTEKQYDVIYEKEPRGQVVTYNGIPCTARTCCTRLNRLTEENKELSEQVEYLKKQVKIFKGECNRLTKENTELLEELND